jgi:hypothetical protein
MVEKRIRIIALKGRNIMAMAEGHGRKKDNE